MGGAILVHRLELTADETLDALLPCLDTREPRLHGVLGDLLSTIDRPEGGEADFSFYERRLRRLKPNRLDSLILYMYEVAPAGAMESMGRVYGGGGPESGSTSRHARDLEALLAAHEGAAGWTDADLGRAMNLRERLSADPAWWKRLYSAVVLGSHPELRSPDTDDPLQVDPDPLVRAAMSR
jgi:hypothetical protein